MRKNIWDFWAGHYDRLWVQRVSLGPTRRAIIKNLPLRSGLRILDVGCGTGQLLGDLKTHFGRTAFSYRGIDKSGGMIEAARLKFPDGDFLVGSSDIQNSEGAVYDVIICAHSFPYFTDKARVLGRLQRLLSSGGVLMIAQASMNNLYDVLALSIVKLTTSEAEYPGRRRMRAMAEPIFHLMPEETRISPNIFIPSIYLFKWIKKEWVLT
jgi:ubiquinone/menaquinone biosynthesis C-methylase UbiE